jgi:hypothetical protein
MIRLLCILILPLGLSCRRSPDMASDLPPPTSPAPAPDATPAPAPDATPAGETPHVDFGPAFEPVAFAPGRYASAIQRKTQGTHARQWVREDSTASLLLELQPDGAATACRGWRYSMFNDGPTVHTEERFREQQGYRGRHALQDGFVEVELQTDDTVCPPTREYQRVPHRSATVKLRCALVVPRDHASLTSPVLLCQWIDAPTRGADPLMVPDIVPDGWIALGTGNGLRIKVSGQPAGFKPATPSEIAVETAPAPLGPDAWAHPF